MGLFAKDGIPKVVLRAVAPSLGVGETVQHYAMVKEPGTSAMWVVALTEHQLFVFASKQAKAGPPPLGTPVTQARLSVRASMGGRSPLEITLINAAPQTFEVLDLWRRQVEDMAAAIGTGGV